MFPFGCFTDYKILIQIKTMTSMCTSAPNCLPLQPWRQKIVLCICSYLDLYASILTAFTLFPVRRRAIIITPLIFTTVPKSKTVQSNQYLFPNPFVRNIPQQNLLVDHYTRLRRKGMNNSKLAGTTMYIKLCIYNLFFLWGGVLLTLTKFL